MITRDEIKFTKFIARIRKKFTHLFLDALKIQLVVKGICTLDDWELIRPQIQFDFMRDNHYAELKEAELMRGRLNILQLIDPFVGKYYSATYVKKHILRLDDESLKFLEFIPEAAHIALANGPFTGGEPVRHRLSP